MLRRMDDREPLADDKTKDRGEMEEAARHRSARSFRFVLMVRMF